MLYYFTQLSMKKQYSIQWMHCVSCANIIQDKLSPHEGVDEIQINVATKTMNINHDEAISVDTLNNILTPYGYTLKDEKEKEEGKKYDHHMHHHNDEKKSYTDMLVSTILAVIAIIAMTYMIGMDYERWPKNIAIHHIIKWFLPLWALYMYATVGKKYLVAIKRYILHRTANMDTLVWLGTGTAFVYSFLASTLHDVFPTIFWTQLFYEAVIVVIWFVELWKYLEHRVMSKTGDAIKALAWLQAKSAILIVDGQEQEIPLEDIKKWDIMLIKPWEKIPLDGIIVSWSAHIDESMITGEPIPVIKQEWEVVIWWTICTNSSIQVQATAIWSETYLQKIIAIVQEAQTSKPAIQKLADTIMQYFIPSVLIIAVSAWLFWLLFWTSLFPWINAGQFALMTFVWVLVIACPCGLWLATPMAVITGIWQWAKNGILAKNAEWLLKLRKTQIVIFDKTGTITEGKPELVEMSTSDENIISILASLESLSSHPIAQAIVSYAKHNSIGIDEVQDYKNLEWVGVQWTIGWINYTISKASYLDTIWIKYDHKIIDKRTKQGKTPLILTDNKKNVLWYFAVADQIKDISKDAVTQLKKQNIMPVMLTGDHENTANYIAWLVWIDHIHAGVTPEEKADIVKQYQAQWVVCMVGDGINDAPALATADIWVAMSTGTDVAIESAELTLLHGDLSKLLKAISISKLTQSAIIQNLWWAFGFNLIGIPLAAGVFYPIFWVLLNPAFEWMAMSMSSLTVMLNSRRLQKKKI